MRQGRNFFRELNALAGDDTSVGGLAARYASALFDLADEQKKLDTVAGDLAGLKEVIAQSPDLRDFLRSPLYDRVQQGKAMASILEKAGADDLTQRFVQVVARNRRLFAMSGIIEAFLAELARRRGEVTAEVVSATELSAEQQEALRAAIAGTGGNTVNLDLRVDPNILGGLVVKVGSRMFDSSLKSKLQRLQFAMKGVG